MGRQALGSTQTDGELDDFEPVQNGESFGLASLDFARDEGSAP